MQKRKLLLLLISFFSLQSRAQDSLLVMEKALLIALKNNYSILIEQNNYVIADNNNTYGNAGMLPQLVFNASGNKAKNNTKQEFSIGTSINKKGVASSTLNSGLVLSWTVFDGFRMFATKEKLSQLETMSELQWRMQIENTIVQVMNAYCDLVRQRQLINALEETIKIAEERYAIAKKKNEIGSGSRVDYLQAKIDLNEQRSALLRQKSTLALSRAALNQLMVLPAETEYSVVDSIQNVDPIKYEELKTQLKKHNNMLLWGERTVKVAECSLREINAQRYPKLQLLGNYNFSRAENKAGLVLQNQTLGANVGFNFSWSLFNGYVVNQQYKNGQLQLLNSKLNYEMQKSIAEADLLKAYRKLTDEMEIFVLEKENIDLAKENVHIALERFRLGNSTSLELKEAEKSYTEAITRLVTVQYNVKIAETELLRLSGQLISK